MTDATPQYEAFLLQCRDSGSLNFPIIAQDVGLDWTKDVKPMLVEDADFRLLFVSYLEELKWTYVDSIRIRASHGINKKKDSNTHTYTKETIRYLDALIAALTKLNARTPQLIADLSSLDDYMSGDGEYPAWTGTPSRSQDS